jgi:hypothetical protein
MRIAALVLLGLLVVAAVSFVAWLAWMNRASEKVITAIIAAMVALVGAPIAVLVFGEELPITEVFPVGFIYEVKSKMPPNLPWSLTNRRFMPSLFAPAQLYKTAQICSLIPRTNWVQSCTTTSCSGRLSTG